MRAHIQYGTFYCLREVGRLYALAMQEEKHVATSARGTVLYCALACGFPIQVVYDTK